MPGSLPNPRRFVGLDVHRQYIVAVGVDGDKNQIFGPQRVEIPRLAEWARKRLSPQDAVVLEMTTNTYEVYDTLKPFVQSITVVHPPHVALVTRVQIKTDEKAALALARLHAAGLLEGIWIPPDDVRDLRALVAERRKLIRLQTQVKNRLHSVLHRCHVFLPPGSPFSDKNREWWTGLEVTPLERTRIQGYLETLEFIERQISNLDASLAQATIQGPRLPLLIQLPGVGFVVATTILSAIGPISRFRSASELVGYAGLGTRVHDSGETRKTGRITKAGRRDLRSVMVEAAQSAARTHPFWKGELERLQVRLGRKKAIVAIARKLLVVVWHVLTKGTVDCHAHPQKVACSLFALAYKVGVRNLPDGQSAAGFTREQLDRLGIGQELTDIPWGRKRPKVPVSSLVHSGS